MAKPDITPLANAVDRLREGLARHRSEPADEQLRDGLIQRFEVSYELCHRVLRRFIRERSASPEDVDRMAFQDLIRTANQQGLLLGDWPAWHRYRDFRARTSHTYHAETARQVVEAIPSFLVEAEYLRDELQMRLAWPGQSIFRRTSGRLSAMPSAGICRPARGSGCSVPRASGTARRYSDLDLALEADEPLGLAVLADMAEALSESDLPYKVDVIDLRSVDPAFRALTEPEMVALAV